MPLSVTLVLCALAGCAPSPEPASVAGRSVLPVAQEADKPDINPDRIKRDVVGRVVQVADVTGVRPRTEWTFEAGEFRQVEILEKHVTDTRFTLVIFMTTRNNPAADEDPVQVSGKLRLHYERKGSQWILKAIDNLTFRYSVGLST